jgi:hypothetical protein
VRVAVLVVLVAAGLAGFSGRRVAAAPPAFATFSKGSVPVADGARSVAVGDVDRDDALDLVAANEQSSTVSVALGNGDGTFAEHVEYAVGGSPQSLALDDVDGDDSLDIAVANGAGVSVLLGNGDGTFTAPAAFSLGGSAVWVTTGDVDEDGDLDLAVATLDGASGRAAWILTGNGDGTFATPYVVHTMNMGSVAVTLADVDGDAHLDLLSADSDISRVSVLTGDGAGSFSSPSPVFTYFDRPMSVTVEDLDVDGDADLVVPTRFDGSVSVFLGDGEGSFGPRVKYLTPNRPDARSAKVGDFNGDTLPDLVAGDASRAWVLLGNGDGTFGSAGVYGICCGTATSVATGDLNGDAWLDIASTAYSPGGSADSVRVLLNTGGIVMAAPVASVSASGVTVSWNPPEAAATVTGYTVTVAPLDGPAQPPVITYSSTANSAVVTNLTNGRTYTFRVAAANVLGTGPSSPPSDPVAPATALDAPTIGTATDDGNGGAIVTWTAPAADGGFPVTGYVVTSYIGYLATGSVTFSSTTTTGAIGDLRDGQTYRFRVRALNALGSSAPSKVTNPITAEHVAPHPPTGVTAVVGDGYAIVSWSEPPNGGSPITGYVVTPYIGYIAQPSWPVDTNRTTQPIGLDRGKTYRFRVRAVNAIGTGAYSKVSAAVTTPT